MASLRDKTISGIFWSFLQKIGYRGISFIVMILLARLLTPKAFGLIGMLMIFIQVSQAVVEGGFNLALIQKKNTDELDYSSVFWINLVVSLCIYLVVFSSAPFISDFYEQPILTQLVRVLALVFVINAFSIVQEARLTKDIKFKKLMLVQIPSSLIAGGISVFMAFNDCGVWSLVAYQVVNRLAYAVQLWLHAKWKPLFTFQWRRIKTLFNFGGKLLVAKIIGVIYNNIFLVVIGKFYPVKSVGYYQNSFNMVSLPAGTITSVLSNVTFPAFSSVQDDNVKLKIGYRKVMQQAFFWICPLYIFAGILAEPLFGLVFGEKWLPAVPYFQWLCIVGILSPLNTYNLNIVNVKGRSDVFLRLQLIRRGITILAILMVFPLGITALLVVQAGSSVFTFCLFSYFSGRFIDYSLREQVLDILPIVAISLGVGLGLFFLNNLVAPILSNATSLLVGVFVGVSIYLLLGRIFKITAYTEAKHIFTTKIKTRFLSRK